MLRITKIELMLLVGLFLMLPQKAFMYELIDSFNVTTTGMTTTSVQWVSPVNGTVFQMYPWVTQLNNTGGYFTLNGVNSNYTYWGGTGSAELAGASFSGGVPVVYGQEYTMSIAFGASPNAWYGDGTHVAYELWGDIDSIPTASSTIDFLNHDTTFAKFDRWILTYDIQEFEQNFNTSSLYFGVRYTVNSSTQYNIDQKLENTFFTNTKEITVGREWQIGDTVHAVPFMCDTMLDPDLLSICFSDHGIMGEQMDFEIVTGTPNYATSTGCIYNVNFDGTFSWVCPDDDLLYPTSTAFAFCDDFVLGKFCDIMAFLFVPDSRYMNLFLETLPSKLENKIVIGAFYEAQSYINQITSTAMTTTLNFAVKVADIPTTTVPFLELESDEINDFRIPMRTYLAYGIWIGFLAYLINRIMHYRI